MDRRRRSGGRLDDVMSDLSALSIAAYFVQCRESRYPPRRSRAAKRALCGVRRKPARAESTRSARRASRVKPHFDKLNAIPSPGRVGKEDSPININQLE